MHLPQFTADSSLYVSGRHYRTGEYRWQGAGVQLALRTGLVVRPQQENCCGDPEYCCNPGWDCVVDSDNNFSGCCPPGSTPCFDAGGDHTCCDVGWVCCGENGCQRQSTDPCATCGESCSHTQICCSPKGMKPYCTDASSDSKNCGSCSNVCSTGQICLNGNCWHATPPCKGKAVVSAPGTALGLSLLGDEEAAYVAAYQDAERQCRKRADDCIGKCLLSPVVTSCQPGVIPGQKLFEHHGLSTTCELPFTCGCFCQ